MGRFSRSWALAKESYAVLKANPQLAIFPVISGIVSVIVAASFMIPLFLLGKAANHTQSPSPAFYGVLFLFYIASYFVVIFFNSALVSCAYESLNGRPVTFKDGIANALRHLGPIFG